MKFLAATGADLLVGLLGLLGAHWRPILADIFEGLCQDPWSTRLTALNRRGIEVGA